MITYATNTPEKGYQLMVPGEVNERFNLASYTHVWVYDPETFNDDAPHWTKYSATA